MKAQVNHSKFSPKLSLQNKTQIEEKIFFFYLWKQNMSSQKSLEMLGQLKQDSYLHKHYDFQEVLGEGCFGKIIKAYSRDIQQHIALKVEKFKKTKLKMVLKNEANLLKQLQGKQGIPKIYNSGEWDHGTFLELELLDHDLNRSHQYSPTEIIDLAQEAIRILEGVHSVDIIHQDLKPHNFMRNKDGKLYLIDFGLAKQLVNKKGNPSMRGFVGTPRYASVRAHNMMDQGKKDDLQSLFYNLAYLYYRRLPWSKLSVSSDQRLDKIKMLKIKHRESLFVEMPAMFRRAFEYIVSLNHNEEPDYSKLKNYFRRNKTILIEPKVLINSVEDKKVKRISLTTSNFLQVPQSPYLPQSPRKKKEQIDTSLEHIPSIGRMPSCSDLSAFSEVIQTHLLALVDTDESNYKQDENIEPELPSFHTIKSLTFKNPFGMQA